MRVESAATSAQIAKVVGYTPEHVRRIQSAWLRDGDSALLGPGMKGWRRRETMKLEEEKEMLESMREKASKGEIVKASTIHEECERRVGRKVNISIVRKMMKRHKWRKVVPRARHPKADEAVQEEYEKTLRKQSGKEFRKARRLRLEPMVKIQDESRHGRINRPRACWCPPGMRPSVGCQIVREHTYLYRAVNPIDGTGDFLVLPSMKADCFPVFAEEICRRYPDNFVLLVCDGAASHL